MTRPSISFETDKSHFLFFKLAPNWQAFSANGVLHTTQVDS